MVTLHLFRQIPHIFKSLHFEVTSVHTYPNLLRTLKVSTLEGYNQIELTRHATTDLYYVQV